MISFEAESCCYRVLIARTQRIRLDAEDHAIVSTAGHEMGMGTATVQAQHAAGRLGLPLQQVTFEYGDSSLPAGAMAGGSAGTLAAAAAAEALVKDLRKLAGNDSRLAGLTSAEVVVQEAGFDCGRILNRKTAVS